MVQADTKRVLPALRKFHVDYGNPDDWIPKDQPKRLLSPGLAELNKGPAKGTRWGWTDKYLADKNWTPKCRFCGSEMFIVEETDNAFVFACAMETCPNNQDNWKNGNYYYRNARKRMGKIVEDAWEKTFDDIPPDMMQYFK